MIDSHAHLNYKAFQKDRNEVIQRCLDQDLSVINPGSQLDTSQLAVELAEQHPGQLFAAVGFHPIHSAKMKFELEDFRHLIKEHPSSIKAIGEIGLDYYHLEAESQEEIDAIKNHQKEILQSQINLAKEHGLPIIMHCRDAYTDLIDQIEKGELPAGVVHCFLGNREIAQKFLKLGFYLGFTGIITFTKDQDLIGVIKEIPLDKVLIETDSPYLAPVPYRGQRNEPLYVRYVAEKIAQIKNLAFEEVVEATTNNAKRLFRLDNR
ncbi:MAG: TatD family hydrolase [Patescibacteria group bacterium]|nr:TatD family hydrolase [Patescibacteria group bacterium]